MTRRQFTYAIKKLDNSGLDRMIGDLFYLMNGEDPLTEAQFDEQWEYDHNLNACFREAERRGLDLDVSKYIDFEEDGDEYMYYVQQFDKKFRN